MSFLFWQRIKMMECRDLVTILRGGVNFELLKDFRFYFKEKMDKHYLSEWSFENGIPFIEVPKGFITDFGSIPNLFQSIISPVGKPTKAYVLHDYLCELNKQGKIKRKDGDKIFLKALEIQKVNRFKRYLTYFSVRVYALIKGIK